MSETLEREATIGLVAEEQKEFVGRWEIGGPSGLAIYLTEKPNIFRRFFVKLFFGVKWINEK